MSEPISTAEAVAACERHLRFDANACGIELRRDALEAILTAVRELTAERDHLRSVLKKTEDGRNAQQRIDAARIICLGAQRDELIAERHSHWEGQLQQAIFIARTEYRVDLEQARDQVFVLTAERDRLREENEQFTREHDAHAARRSGAP